MTRLVFTSTTREHTAVNIPSMSPTYLARRNVTTLSSPMLSAFRRRSVSSILLQDNSLYAPSHGEDWFEKLLANYRTRSLVVTRSGDKFDVKLSAYCYTSNRNSNRERCNRGEYDFESLLAIEFGCQIDTTLPSFRGAAQCRSTSCWTREEMISVASRISRE